MSTLIQRLDKILINLDIISRIEQNQRPIFKNSAITIRNYYIIFTSIIRSISNESRDDILVGLKELYSNINNIFDDYINDINYEETLFDKEVINSTINSLNRLKTAIPLIYDKPDLGFNALNITYAIDAEFLARLHVLTDDFKILYRKICNKIDSLKSISVI